MRDPNYFNVIGRFGRDPEVKYTQGGHVLVMFSLACGRGNNKDGADMGVDWLDCKAWRKVAELIGQYMRKGSFVYVSGRVSQDSWTDKEGNPKQRMFLQVDNIRFLDGKGSSGTKENSSPPERTEMSGVNEANGMPPGGDNPLSEPDIPF